MKPHHPRAGAFNSAYRRIYSRRERLYSRDNPNIVAERLDVAEDAPPLPSRAARDRALTHLSVAYAAAGYAQAALCVVVSLALAAGVAAFARGVYADVARKTRLRADALAIDAAECYLARTNNGCVVGDDGASHVTPALDALCKKWLACERRAKFIQADAMSASVWAETFAETVNSFSDRISSTAVVLALAGAVVVVFMMSSAAFGFMHKRLVEERVAEGRMLTHGVMERDAPFGGVLAAEAQHPQHRGNRAITYGDQRDSLQGRSPAR